PRLPHGRGRADDDASRYAAAARELALGHRAVELEEAHRTGGGEPAVLRAHLLLRARETCEEQWLRWFAHDLARFRLRADFAGRSGSITRSQSSAMTSSARAIPRT